MGYSMHETLEVHEITALKTVCLTKSKAMQILVSDPELKAIMKQDVETSARHLQQLEIILSRAARGQEGLS